MYQKIEEFEAETKEASGLSDLYEMDIRDMGKKVQKQELTMEDMLEALQSTASKMEVAETKRTSMPKLGESRISVENLAYTALKLPSSPRMRTQL